MISLQAQHRDQEASAAIGIYQQHTKNELPWQHTSITIVACSLLASSQADVWLLDCQTHLRP